MLALRRTVRFCINPDGSAGGSNGAGGIPRMSGFGRHFELDVSCRGDADPETGYLVDIKRIDDAVRSRAIPVLSAACRAPGSEPVAVLPALLRGLCVDLGPLLDGIRLHLTPTWSIGMSIQSTTRVRLRQSFEVAASHRLHSPSLTEEENRRVFGKCNNPAGHGHNYRIEPAFDIDLDANGVARFSLGELESLAERLLVGWLDHRHLNSDLPAFDPERGGVVPSVENICRLCYERLEAATSATAGVELRHVTVWETERTSCRYPAR